MIDRKIIILGSTILAAAGILTAGVMLRNSEKQVTYKETQVVFGNLMVGVTEEGSVDIGSVEQTFELDMSALQRATTSTSGNRQNTQGGNGNAFDNMGAGMGVGLTMFEQVFNLAGGNAMSSYGSDGALEVVDVVVTVGQEVKVGDVLYTLDSESVEEIKEQLSTNVDKAKADLEAVYAEQELSRQQAYYTYETSLAYAGYAQTEYTTKLKSLELAVEEAQSTLESAKTALAHYESQLQGVTTSFDNAKQILENSLYSVDKADKFDDPYGYVSSVQTASEAENQYNTLKQKKEQLEQSVEQAKQNVNTAEKKYNQAVRQQEQGKLSALQTLELRTLAYDTAQETYDITMAYLEDGSAEQEAVYQEVKTAWEEYSSHIAGNTVCAAYNGVVTGVELKQGDRIQTGTVLISLYNMDEVTMTVTLDAADMDDISAGSAAKVLLTAYPDTLFDAVVSEISEASSDSYGNVTYDVTITIQGDVSGLFQGMTGEITFVTEAREEVLYVSRRAIITQNDKSYVKVRKANGGIEKREVTTGFTDGTYVEITEGLSEGETVLIESKVGG